jgi:phosphopantothenoylcysteine decarboxylase/phosphopantothenate--cysteine ligase
VKRKSLNDKKVLLGITGSVAAYKAPDLIKAFKEEGASVSVVMTDASSHFVTPLALEIASGGKVFKGLFDEPMAHISLAREADLMVAAPATANLIGKFASGIADDLITTLLMAFNGPVIVAPAMNWRMYENPTFKKNLKYLKSIGVVEVAPEEGKLACGEEGVGRMASVERIVEAACAALGPRDLGGKKIVVTAGPTREYMDAVRFISNPSTGKMGYALAREAVRRGADVTLISGPSSLTAPDAVKFISVDTAAEMKEAVLKSMRGAHALIMAAAVGDFTPATKSRGKIEKSKVSAIKLKKAPDILSEVGKKRRKPLIVGFAAEAGENLERAKDKLKRKGADIIVFNDITAEGSGFGADTNRVVIIDKKGSKEYPLLPKDEVAGLILDRVASSRG